MTTSDFYRPPRPTVSFELYPPRTPKGEAQVWDTVERLVAADADYFSVTYGAGGSTAERSQALVAKVLGHTPTPVIAHLTCVARPREELREVVGRLMDAGVRDFLALRGDPPADQPDWQPGPHEYGRAQELVALIRDVEAERFGRRREDGLGRLLARRGGERGVSIAVAGYPGHLEADGRYRVRQDELAALRGKQDAGADFAITQLFFDVEAYRALTDAARGAGIHLPLVPGILPLTDAARIRKLCALNGLVEPTDLLAQLDAATPEDAYEIGLRATADLVRGVLDAGAPGLHLYTFNQHAAVLRLLDVALAAA